MPKIQDETPNSPPQPPRELTKTDLKAAHRHTHAISLRAAYRFDVPDSAFTVTYDANAYSGGSASYTGLKSGDTAAVLSGTLAYGGRARPMPGPTASRLQAVSIPASRAMTSATRQLRQH